MPAADSIFDVPCRDIVSNQTVVEIDGSLPIEEACEVLVKSNIQAAPVHDKSTNAYIGNFAYSDIVAYLLLMFHREELKPNENFTMSDIVKKAMKSQPVHAKLAADLSKNNPFYSVAPDAPFLDALRLLAQGLRRLAILDSTGHLHGILSQSAAIKYLSTKLDVLDASKKTLQDLHLVQGNVVTVPASASVMNALVSMSENKVSSLAITDNGGRIVGSISMTDIKYVFRNHKYRLLWRHSGDFINDVRVHQGIEDHGKDHFPVFYVTPQADLKHCIMKLVATHAHRLWICNDKIPIGVLSLTDILKTLLPVSE